MFLPRQAIRLSDNKSYAVVLKNDLPEEIEVQTGIKTPINIEVISGLSAEQDVIIGDWEKLLAEAKKSKTKESSLKKILWMIRSK